MFLDCILKICEGSLLGGSGRKTQAEDALGKREVGVFRELRFGTHDGRDETSIRGVEGDPVRMSDDGGIECFLRVPARLSRSLRTSFPTCQGFGQG